MNQLPSTHLPGRRPGLLVFKGIAGFILFVVMLVLFVLWRDGWFLTGTEGRVAATLREVKKDEQSNSSPGGYIQRLRYSLPSPLDDIFDRIFPNNWRGEYEHVEELVALGTNAVPFLIRAVESETSVATRRVSANALASFEARSATPLLARILRDDPNPEVRQAMAVALWILADTNSVPQLLEGLAKDDDGTVRAQCAAALGALQVKSTAPLILSGLESEQDRNNQQLLIAALGRLRYEPAVPLLVRHLQTPAPRTNSPALGGSYYSSYDEQQVRSESAKALAAIGGEASREALVRQLALETDERVGEAICDSLAVVGGSNVVAALRGQLGAKSEFREHVVYALGQLNNDSVVPDLIPLLNDHDDSVQAAAASALGSLGSPAALDALREALDGALDGASSDLVLASVCEALVMVGDQSDTERIIQGFERMGEGHSQVVWVLGHLRDTNVISLLEAQLTNATNESSRFAAAYELALIGTETARIALRQNLGDKDENARHAKACSLLMLGDDTGLATVRKSMRSKNGWQRFGAVLAVDGSGLTNHTELLTARLQDSEAAIRRYASAASIGAGQAALIELLQSAGDEYAQYAARALVYYKNTNAIPTLRLACQDENKEVRSAARLTVRYLERNVSSAGGEN